MDAEVRRQGQAMPHVCIKLSAKHSAPSALSLVNVTKMRKFVMPPSWVFTQLPPDGPVFWAHLTCQKQTRKWCVGGKQIKSCQTYFFRPST